MPALARLGRFAVAEFGPLIVFWALALTLGTKPAIAGAILAILVGAAYKLATRRRFTRLYLLVSGLTRKSTERSSAEVLSAMLSAPAVRVLSEWTTPLAREVVPDV